MGIFIGVDPGLSGAIAIIDEHAQNVVVYDTPTITFKKGKKNKTEYNIAAIHCLLCEYRDSQLPVCAFMEKMQSMPPGIRIQATFSLGYCQGLFEGLFAALGIPYQLVISKHWQKHWQITKPKGDTKAQSYQIASRLFPEAELTGPKGGKKDGRCDALLIAEWGRHTMKGEQ
jgi:crossover junction endodeoxyribonuclease RuvC